MKILFSLFFLVVSFSFVNINEVFDCYGRKGEIVADIYAEKLYICLDDYTGIMIEDCEAKGLYAVDGVCRSEPPTDNFPEYSEKCRCRSDGCYAGSTISLRAPCGVKNSSVDCRKYDYICVDK